MGVTKDLRDRIRYLNMGDSYPFLSVYSINLRLYLLNCILGQENSVMFKGLPVIIGDINKREKDMLWEFLLVLAKVLVKIFAGSKIYLTHFECIEFSKIPIKVAYSLIFTYR